MRYEVKYLDDFNVKHVTYVEDTAEVRFIQERFAVVEYQEKEAFNEVVL